MANSNRLFGVFINMTGFATAIDGLTEEEHNDLEEMLRIPANGPGRAACAVRLSSSYELFHRRLDKLAWKFRLFIQLITFSDSAYALTPDQRVAEQFAIDMMWYCYRSQIPLRAGIGYGNFVRLEFSTLRRGCDVFVAGPFLGSSIVRAYRAQSCKARGFRIFLHPSVPATSGPAWLYNDLTGSEKSPDANREVNFLYQPHCTADEALIALHDMRIGVTDAHVLEHYDASDQAIRRLNELG